MNQQQHRTEVCTWVAWHSAELAALGTPCVLAVTVSTWFWAVAALGGAGWAAHELRQQQRHRALTTATRQQVTSTDDTATETSAASAAGCEGA
jgi:hypothetical protein